ncbi:MAG: hypothetical protein NVSMB21_25670 [Vulcanimicrobiaceae bacterium]
MSSRRPAAFANTTTVAPQKTRAEIETLLERHGATSFAFGTQPGRAVLMFELNDRRVRFVVPIPDAKSEYHGTRARADAEQLERSRWRALLLVVKAKLEAVAVGVSVFEDEFLANLVMADGSSFGDWARPQIATMYGSGKMPPMLPGGVS